MSNFIFAGLFGLSLILFYRIILPFLMPVLLGAFLVVLFIPLQDRLARRIKSKSVAAGVATSIVVGALFVPLVAIGFLVIRELLVVAASAQALLDSPRFRAELMQQIPSGLRRYVHLDAAGSNLDQRISDLLAGSAGLVSELVGAGTELVVDALLMIISMYYFFLDGRRLFAEATRLVPLDPRYIRAFTKEFKDVAYAMIYGNALTAVLQGVTGFVGFLIAGVHNGALWSSAMVLCAWIPVGGTMLVWGPIGIILMVTGKMTQGLFILGWGAFMVGAFDNMVRPKICGARMTLHPLLVFLSMFGGIAVFGMMGLLVGPLIASLFMAMVRIYRTDFLPGRAAHALREKEREHNRHDHDTPAVVPAADADHGPAVLDPAALAALDS